MYEFTVQGYCQIIFNLLCLALATERTVELIVDSKFFAPLRNYIAKRAVPEDFDKTYSWWTFRGSSRLLFTFLYGVTSCGYCMSVWVALFYTFMYQAPVVTNVYGNYLVNTVLLHGLSNLYHVLYMRLYRGQVNYTHLTIKLEESTDQEG